MGPVSCSHECGPEGHSCRLRYDAIVRGLHCAILERGGRLSVYAFAQAELPRLREKRLFLERLGVQCVSEISCKQTQTVDGMVTDVEQRMTKWLELMR